MGFSLKKAAKKVAGSAKKVAKKAVTKPVSTGKSFLKNPSKALSNVGKSARNVAKQPTQWGKDIGQSTLNTTKSLHRVGKLASDPRRILSNAKDLGANLRDPSKRRSLLNPVKALKNTKMGQDLSEAGKRVVTEADPVDRTVSKVTGAKGWTGVMGDLYDDPKKFAQSYGTAKGQYGHLQGVMAGPAIKYGYKEQINPIYDKWGVDQQKRQALMPQIASTVGMVAGRINPAWGWLGPAVGMAGSAVEGIDDYKVALRNAAAGAAGWAGGAAGGALGNLASGASTAGAAGGAGAGAAGAGLGAGAAGAGAGAAAGSAGIGSTLGSAALNAAGQYAAAKGTEALNEKIVAPAAQASAEYAQKEAFRKQYGMDPEVAQAQYAQLQQELSSGSFLQELNAVRLQNGLPPMSQADLDAAVAQMGAG